MDTSEKSLGLLLILFHFVPHALDLFVLDLVAGERHGAVEFGHDVGFVELFPNEILRRRDVSHLPVLELTSSHLPRVVVTSLLKPLRDVILEERLS